MTYRGKRGGARNVAPPPSESDWGAVESGDLDAEYARKQFLGKTYLEAKAMFERNALHYGEDLESMPYTPFNYYAPAFADYITASEAAGDSDGASSFLRRTTWLLSNLPELFSPQTKQTMLKAAQAVAANQSFYEADVEIYGRFSELLSQLEELSS